MAMRKTSVALCTDIAVQAFGPASDVVRAGVEAQARPWTATHSR